MEKRPFNHTGFSAYLSENKLMGSRCLSCQAVYLPPMAMCTRCYSDQMEWLPFSGKGALESFSIIYTPLPELAAVGRGRDCPYTVGIVRLEEGGLISAQIMDGGCTEPTQMQIDMPLHIVYPEWLTTPSGEMILTFQPD
jgi:uncharacterized OB-fold protein